MVNRGASLNIVHILRAPMGGVLRHVRDLVVAHSKLGHNVGLICDVEGGSAGYNEAALQDLSAHLSLGLHRVPMARSVGPRDVFSGRKILKLLRDLKPDVVHGHGAKGGLFARTCAGLATGGKAARFYSPHGGSLHYDPASAKGRLFFNAERAMEKATDRIFFVAQYEQRTYEAKIGKPSCATSVVYNGLQESEFEPVNMIGHPVDFLFIGEMRMLKGPDIFLEALSELRAKGEARVTAVMVGDGVDAAEITTLNKTLNLSDFVKIRPPMPAREAFALAKTVVIPSRAEAMPYIVIEALAARKTVISSDVGGIPEIFERNPDVMISPDTASLAAAMRRALNEPAETKKRMPDPAWLKARFSAAVMAEQILNHYQAHTAKQD